MVDGISEYVIVLLGFLGVMGLAFALKKALIFYPALKLENRIIELYNICYYTFKSKEKILELLLDTGEYITIKGKEAIQCFKIIQEYGHLFGLEGVVE